MQFIGNPRSEFCAPSLPLPGDESARQVVLDILQQHANRTANMERRHQRRYLFPYLVQLTPVDRRLQPMVEQTIVVVGKHISPGGFDFYHHEPIAHKQVIVTLSDQSGEQSSLLLELLWCRFKRHGWYDNGGRFLRTIETPVCCGGVAASA